MATLRTLLLLATLSLSACATTAGPGYGSQRAANGCPVGQVLICMPDTRRYCRCGELIFD